MRMPIQNSPLGGIAQQMNDTMLKFFLSQPTALERDYMQAGTDLRRASLETERMKARTAQQAYDAPRTIAEAFRGMVSPPEAARLSPDMMGPMPQMSPDQAVARYLPDALQGVAALNTGDIGSVFRALVANTPGTSNEAVTRAFAGAGGKLGVNDALLPGRQDQLRTENFGQETALNNANNAAAMARQISANAAAMARHRMTEAVARGAAFNALSPEQQALAVGPTAAEAQGGLISRYFGDLGSLDPYQRQVLGANPSTGSSTPRNYITADGRQGVTLDGVTDAATNEPIPAGAQVFTGQVQGSAANAMVPASVRGRAMEAEIGADDLMSALDRIDVYASDPANFGLGGIIQRTAQNTLGHARSGVEVLGGDPAIVEGVERMLPPKMQGYNPDLAAIDSELRTVAFRLKTMVGEDRLSNEDRQEFARIAGSAANTAEEVRARSATLRRIAAAHDLAVDNVMGAPPRATPRPDRGAPPAPAAPQPAAPPPAASKPRIKIDAQGRIIH